MDPEELKLLQEQMDRLVNTSQSTGERVRELFFGELERGAEGTIEKLKELAREAESRGDDIGEALRNPFESGLRAAEVFKDKVKRSVKDASDYAKREFQAMGEVQRRELGRLGRQIDERALRGRDRAGGFLTGLQQLTSTVFAGLPFGGILGVMLFGRMQEAEFFSKAQQASQVLQRAGALGSQITRQLAGDIRSLEQTIPGITSNFLAANSAFAEMGFTGRDAAQSIDQDLLGARDTVLNLTVAMDKFFEAGEGRSAQLATEIARNTNGSLRESVELVRDIGLAVQDTGMSFGGMLGSVLQVTSALRLQTNELEESRSIAENIQKAQAGFQAQGMTTQRAGALATAGLQGVAGALNNMQIGLKSVMGERLGARMGQDVRGLDAVMQFETGFRGQADSQFFQRSIEEVINLSTELGKGDPARQYQVLKSLFGMNAEQAQTLMAIQKSAQDGMPIEKAAEKHMDSLNKAFKDEALKQSVFKTMINRLIQVVAKVGSSLLDVLVTGLEMLVASVTYLTKYVTVGTTDSEQAAYTRYMMSSSGRTDRAFRTAFDQMRESKEIAELFGKTVLRRSNAEIQASGTYWTEMSKRDRPGERRSAMDDARGLIPGASLFGSNQPAPRDDVELVMDTPLNFMPGDKLTARLRKVAGSTKEPR